MCTHVNNFWLRVTNFTLKIGIQQPPYSHSNPCVKINIIQSNITQPYDTLTTLKRHRKLCYRPPVTWTCTVFFIKVWGPTVNVNRARKLTVSALIVRIFSAAVGKLCSRLHAVMWMCFNSRKGRGRDTKQTELALRRIITISLYHEACSLPGNVTFRGE